MGGAAAEETREFVCADSVEIEQTVTLAKNASPMKGAGSFTGVLEQRDRIFIIKSRISLRVPGSFAHAHRNSCGTVKQKVRRRNPGIKQRRAGIESCWLLILLIKLLPPLRDGSEYEPLE
jgi:hypothetical protein